MERNGGGGEALKEGAPSVGWGGGGALGKWGGAKCHEDGGGAG